MSAIASGAPMRALILLGACAAAALLLAFAVTPGVSTLGLLLTLAAGGVALCRPLDGLLIVAGLAPLGAAIGALLDLPVPWTEPLVLAVLLGAAIRGLLTREPLPPWDPLTGSAAAFALLVLSSWLLLQVPAVHADAAAAIRDVGRSIAREYIVAGNVPLRTAATQCAGIALLVLTAVECRRTPGSVDRLITMMVLGATAAAVQSLVRLLGAALRTGEPVWLAVLALSERVRIAAAFPDVNASGSYFALAIGLALAAAAGRGWRRASAWGAVIVLLAALWASGSRAAILALPLSAALIGFAMWRERVSRRATVVLAAALTCVLIGLALAGGRMARHTDAWTAARIRVEFARTTARILIDHPLFGAGVGQYARASALYGSDWLRSHYPAENAHNQFLQVAGELGLIGLAVFLSVLVAALAGPLRRWRETREARLGALLLGLLAFVLTWVSGHPLLIAGVAIAFYLAAGVTSGTSAVAPAHATSPGLTRLRSSAWTATIVAIVLALPVRAALEWTSLATSGLGPWQQDAEGRDYRAFKGRAVVRLTPRRNILTVPVRLPDDSGTPARVQLRVRGVTLVDDRIESREWVEHRIRLPAVAPGESIDLEILARDAERGTDRELRLGRLGP